jgi:hypothetical protein
MKNIFLIVGVVLFGTLSFACSGTSKREAVKLDDRSVRTRDSEAVPEQEPAAPSVNTESAFARERKFGEERTLYDNSRLVISYDGSGNKTETRSFAEGSELKAVIVRTSPDGTAEATLYSQNGQVRLVPSSMTGRALSAPAGELSKAIDVVADRNPQAQPAQVSVAAPVTPKAVSRVSSESPSIPSSDIRLDQLPPVVKSEKPTTR